MTDADKAISLDSRLLKCADFVRDKVKVVDVGTDHAYLSIHLVKCKKATYVIASDLRKGPLDNALTNIKRFGCEDLIETRLSNGLAGVGACEVDDIIVAGMGGEAIAKIIDGASWLKDSKKRLILQPMTMAEHLRKFLFNNGFKIIKESAVISGSKVYTIMKAEFFEGSMEVSDLYTYIGGLEQNLDDAAVKYIEKEIRDLKNKILGYRCQGNAKGAETLTMVKNKLENLIHGV